MRDLEAANWYGLWTLYAREVRRFVKVYSQTILGPVATALLFLAIFALALGRAVQTVGGMPFMEFLAPGLIMMAIAQNAFANTATSLFIAKVQGSIVDTLMPPLTAHELTLGMTMAGVTRGVVVAFAVAAGMAPFVPLGVHHAGFIVFHALAGSLMLSLLGTMTAIWAEKFDQLSGVTNFLVTPLAFLSGTFYSIERLPATFQAIAQANPFFYMIDGFRFGMVGHADGSLAAGVAVLACVNGVLWFCCHRMFASGYRLKA